MTTRRSLLSLAASAAAASADRRPPEFNNIKWVNPGAKLPRGVAHKTLLSKAMGKDIGFHVYLPPKYESTSDRYPVLYWLHGAGSDETAGLPNAEMLDRAIQGGQMPPVILVMPNGGKRSEYRDWEPQQVMPESFIIRELIPFIDGSYRTMKERRARWIEGMSMGGNGSLKLALKYPDLFSSVVAYAGSYRPFPKDGSIYPGITPESRLWIEQLAQWYSASDDVFELAAHNRFRLDGMRIRLVIGTRDISLPDSEVLHAHFQKIGVVHEYELLLGVTHATAAYYNRAGVEGFRFHLPALDAKG
ncbi:MAG TPA: alpha/beta hydrolase-fold protein [Bryobacteraceae bacterium]|nr:alpha/beta hydrolase-fold protein [Bryobacteraceae bacterium]